MHSSAWTCQFQTCHPLFHHLTTQLLTQLLTQLHRPYYKPPRQPALLHYWAAHFISSTLRAASAWSNIRRAPVSPHFGSRQPSSLHCNSSRCPSLQYFLFAILALRLCSRNSAVLNRWRVARAKIAMILLLLVALLRYLTRLAELSANRTSQRKRFSQTTQLVSSSHDGRLTEIYDGR